MIRAIPSFAGDTAVVTGGAGFVGSHLVDRLLADGLRVVALDNFVTGKPENLAHLEGREDFRLIEHDVSEPYEIDGDIAFVFHMASPSSPIDYIEIPIATLKAGSCASHHALELAKQKGAVYLVASTSEIYGDPEVHPQPETYWGNVNSIGVRSCYDEAKRYAEAVAMAYHRAHGLDTRIVRIFNTYGPRMRLDDGRVVPAFIGQALRGEPMTIFGDGRQTRSFCYVSDLVEGIWRLARSDFHEPVNCGNPDEMTIRRFAEEIARLFEIELRVEDRPLPSDDPKLRKPDISRAREILGWEPVIPFDQGIRETIDYFRGVLPGPAS
jgi:dTDP-glucose 4,6-dehydratase